MKKLSISRRPSKKFEELTENIIPEHRISNLHIFIEGILIALFCSFGFLIIYLIFLLTRN